MKKNMGKVVGIVNVIYYVDIFTMIYMHTIDYNSPVWLLSIALVIVGIIGSSIPDIMINLGVAGISKKLSFIQVLIKFMIFAICNIFLNEYYIFALTGVAILTVVDIVCEKVLITQIFKARVTINEFINKLGAVDTSATDGIIKYIWCNIFMILIFLNVHESIYELVVTLTISIAVYCFTSEKVVKAVNIKYRCRARITFGVVEIVMLVLAYFKYDMLVYVAGGIYYGTVIDFLIEKETSLIKLSRFNDKNKYSSQNDKELK